MTRDEIVEVMARALCRDENSYDENVEAEAWRGNKHLYRAAATAALDALAAKGCAVVPREPTEKMEEAGQALLNAGYVDQVLTDSPAVWTAMLNAAEEE